MIAVKLMGGLGNQMFQYAAAKALSMKHNTSLVLDTSFLDNKMESHVARNYELDIFPVTSSINNKGYYLKDKVSFAGLIKSRLSGRTGLTYIKEKQYSFDPSVLNSPDNSYLDGYWQSSKYFDAIKQTIFSDFSFTKRLNPFFNAVLERITNSTSAFVHVRRGDYANNSSANAFHGLMGMDYYKAAMARMRARFPDCVLFIFTDDVEWSIENFRSEEGCIVVSDATYSSTYDDLLLMTSCKHAIIANSSYSWWAAYLMKNATKTIIAPKAWFADSSINTHDLIPESWTRI